MTTRYIFCKCNDNNKSFSPMDWGNNGLICFATCRAVAIYELSTYTGRVVCTLHRHRNEVKIVKWIKQRNDEPETELFSCCSSSIIIWSKDHQGNSFRDTSILNLGRRYQIEFANYFQLTDNALSTRPRLLIYTMSYHKVNICLREEDNANIKVIQTLNFCKKNMKTLTKCCLIYLQNKKHFLMAISLLNKCVWLYASDALELNFVRVHYLECINNINYPRWVQYVDFIYDNGCIFLSDSLQLWKIEELAAQTSNDDIMMSTARSLYDRQTFAINDTEYIIKFVESFDRSYPTDMQFWPKNTNIKREKSDDHQSTRLILSSMIMPIIISKLNSSHISEKEYIWLTDSKQFIFEICTYNPKEQEILGRVGSDILHVWKYSQEIEEWIPRTIWIGHYRKVIDLCWEPKGRFLLTSSKYRSITIHAPWKDEFEERWHVIECSEMTEKRRGYYSYFSHVIMLAPNMYAYVIDINTVYICTATSTFINRLESLTNVDDLKSLVASDAIVSSQDLKNKIRFNEEIIEYENEQNPTTDNYEYKMPTGTELEENTSWIKLQEIFEPDVEIFCIAARHDGCLLAVACKVVSLGQIAIILWDTTTWSQIQKLVSHERIITQIEFSPNDKYLLSVSRDRTCSLFRYNDGIYVLIATSAKTDSLHHRGMTCCAWTWDSNYFASGSNGGKVGIWSIKTEQNNARILRETTLIETCRQLVTALCFAPNSISQGSYVLAIGYNIGHIDIYILNIKIVAWTKLVRYDTSEAHHLSVNRLRFRPINKQSSNILCLASCSSDCSVKIRDIDLSLLISKDGKLPSN